MDRDSRSDSGYKTGDKPPDGMYVCLSCNTGDPYVAVVPEIHQALPMCPNCGGVHWMRI